MKLSLESIKNVEADIEAEVERRIKEYPIRVFIDDKDVDTEQVILSGGEMEIHIKTPIFWSYNNTFYKLVKE